MKRELAIRVKRPGDDPAVAGLLAEAFRAKYLVLCGGSMEAALAISNEEIRWRGRGDNFFVALRDGLLRGAIEILTAGIPGVPEKVIFSTCVSHLGMGQGLRSVYLLSLLGREVASNEACVSRLAVARESRRQGIARALIGRGERFAREKDKKYLSLWVAGSNEPALRLYESEGFSIERQTSSALVKKFFGYETWLKLKKEVSIE